MAFNEFNDGASTTKLRSVPSIDDLIMKLNLRKS